MNTEDFLNDLSALLPEDALCRHVAQDYPQFLQESRHSVEGQALAVVFPQNREEVQAILRLCSAHHISLTAQGGNTSRVAAALPLTQDTLLMRFDRLKRIRALNVANASLEVEAGAVLADVQAFAAAHDFFFPVSLGAEHDCTIGGIINHNAGGINVLRYGPTRAHVLGLEAVLADGSLLDLMRPLRKNNAGYDLKQCLIGSEGTLAILTAANLKLSAPERISISAAVALPNMEAVLACLARCHNRLAARISSFEFLSRACVEHTQRVFPDLPPLFAEVPELTVLLRVADSLDDPAPLRTALQEALAHERYRMASDEREAAQLWQWRHAIVAAEKEAGLVFKHDIAVPIDALPAFMQRTAAALQKILPDCRPYPFGHVGDGNIHYNLLKPPHYSDAEFAAYQTPIAQAVYQQALDLQGVFGAEHGIGLLRRDAFQQFSDPNKLALMRRLKDSFDPHHLLNPHKIV